MSAAATAAAAPAAAVPNKGKKKLLLVIIGATLLLLALAGGAAVIVLKKRAAAEAAEAADAEDGAARTAATSTHDRSSPPTFVPLESFVVNLADREVDRFAQVGITLEVEDAKAAERMKAYMPAIRNAILMILAHKNSAELHARSGKEALADEIARATARALGVEVEEPAAAASATAAAPKKKPKKPTEPNPVRQVHFSSFIVQ